MFLEQLALMNDECFLPHVVAGRHFFQKSLSLLLYIFNRHVVTFFDASALKEVRILSFLLRIH